MKPYTKTEIRQLAGVITDQMLEQIYANLQRPPHEQVYVSKILYTNLLQILPVKDE
jgi:hypothetical protein